MASDPSNLLDQLTGDDSDDRLRQLDALEKLCNEVLFSDDIDVFCDKYPPKVFLPVLCLIFMDDKAPPMILETAARAVTYYIEMQAGWCTYVIKFDNALKSFASHLDQVDMYSEKSNEFGQQLIKMLKLITLSDSNSVYASGCLTSVLRFVCNYSIVLHADVLQAGMDLIQRLFSRADSKDPDLAAWIVDLSSLFDCRESGMADQALKAFANLVARFTQTGSDPSPLGDAHIIECLLRRLRIAGGVECSKRVDVWSSSSQDVFTGSGSAVIIDGHAVRDSTASRNVSESNPSVVHAVTNILITLCCNSAVLTRKLLTTDEQFALTLAMVVQSSDDESVVLSVLRLINILLVVVYQTGFNSSQDIPNDNESGVALSVSPSGTYSHTAGVTATTTATPVCEEQPTEAYRPMERVQPLSSACGEQPVTLLSKESHCKPTGTSDSISTDRSGEDSIHRPIIEAIKQKNMDVLETALASGKVDVNYTDNLGQTLLNWAASFGTPAIVEKLCLHGANVTKGVRCSLDYAATFGRAEICPILLNYGADPLKRDGQGKIPIDRARSHIPYPGCQQVVNFLEKVMDKRNEFGQLELPSLGEPTVGYQRLFVRQLFPIIVTLFSESGSLSIRRQCVLLVKCMVSCMDAAHLEEISKIELNSVPFTFSLAQLIYHLLVEETDEYVLHALELAQCLLVKQPLVYQTVFLRFGFQSLVQQLINVWTHTLRQIGLLLTDNAGSVAIAKVTAELMDSSDTPNTRRESCDAATVGPTSDPVLSSLGCLNLSEKLLRNNPLYIWHDWYLLRLEKLLCIFNAYALTVVHLEPTDDKSGLRALVTHSKGNRFGFTVLLRPGRPAIVRDGLQSQMLRVHLHLLDCTKMMVPVPLWSTSADKISDQRYARSFCDGKHGASKIVSSSPFTIQSTHSRGNWRRLNAGLGLRCPPEPPYNSLDHRSKDKRRLDRQASSPARSCLTAHDRKNLRGRSSKISTGTRSPKQVAISIGSVVCSLRKGIQGSRLCVQPHVVPNKDDDSNQQNAVVEALLFSEHYEDGLSRVRISQLSFVASDGKRSSSLSDLDVANMIHCDAVDPVSRKSCGGRSYSANLAAVLADIDAEFTADLSRSNTAIASTTFLQDAPEIFNFDLLYGGYNDDSSDFTDDENIRLEKVGHTSVAVHRELQRLNNMMFPREFVYETYSSGRLSEQLSQSRQSDDATLKERENRTNHRLCLHRKKAFALAKRLAWLLSHSDPLSGHLSATSTATKQPSNDALNRLRCIVFEIWATFHADRSSQPSSTLNKLGNCFQSLSDLLDFGEQSLTAYELASSGLISGLLLCLSVSQANRWRCLVSSPGLNSNTSLLWYLSERRRVFIQKLTGPESSSKALARLVRRLVLAFELTEHLPLRLFALFGQFGEQKIVTSTLNTEKHTSTSSVHDPSSMVLTPVPMGLIRSIRSTPTDVSKSNASNVVTELQQTFGDCMDEKDLLVLRCMCRRLLDLPNHDYTIPGMYQLTCWIPLSITKLSDSQRDNADGESMDIGKPVLKNWTGKNVQINPLATCGQIEQFLLRLSVKQWYENPRTSLPFWHKLNDINDRTERLTFFPPTDGVGHGIECSVGLIDWLSTNAGLLTVEDWVNPVLIGLVSVAASSDKACLGHPASIFGPRAGSIIGGYPVRCSGDGAVIRPSNTRQSQSSSSTQDHEHDDHVWFAVDLGLQLLPSAYSLAYLRRSSMSDISIAPRNWKLQASNDAVSWTLLRNHINDTSIQSSSGSRATWSLSADNSGLSACPHQGWRFFKLQSCGSNEGNGKELAIGGLEFYGTICSIHDELISPEQLSQAIHSCSHKATLTVPNSTVKGQLALSSEVDKQSDSLSTEHTTVTEGNGQIHKSISDSDHEGSARTNSLAPPTSDQRSNFSVDDFVTSEDKSDSSQTGQDDMDHENHEDHEEEEEEDTVGFMNAEDSACRESGEVDVEEDDSEELMHLFDPDIGNATPLRKFEGLAPMKRFPSIFQCEPGHSVIHGQTRDHELEETGQLIVESAFCSALGTMNTDMSSIVQSFDQQTSYAPLDLENNSTRVQNMPWFDETSPQANEQALELNQEEADEMEFADTVEAIIQQNISSCSQPVLRMFSPSRQSHILESNVMSEPSDSDASGRQHRGTLSDRSSTHRSDDTVTALKNYHSTSSAISRLLNLVGIKNDDEEEAQGYEPEVSSLTGIEKVKPLTPVLPPKSSEPDHSVWDANQRKSNSSIPILSNWITFTPTSNNSSNDTVQKSVTHGSKMELLLPNSQAERNANVSSSGKFTGQLRRRPRRPRPQKGIPFSGEPNLNLPKAADLAIFPCMPMSWDEAVESLKLPSGLIPTFDPERNCTNASSTTMFSLCPSPVDRRTVYSNSLRTDHDPRLSLFLIASDESKQISSLLMNDKRRTLFSYIQEIYQLCLQAEEEYKISEARSYRLSIGYRFWLPADDTQPSVNERSPLYSNALLKYEDLRLTPTIFEPIKSTSSGINIAMVTDDPLQNFDQSTADADNPCIYQAFSESALQLLKIIYQLSGLGEPQSTFGLNQCDASNTTTTTTSIFEQQSAAPSSCITGSSIWKFNAGNFGVKPCIEATDFISARLNKKLLRQLHDPLSTASGSLPKWCLNLARGMPSLFTFETRLELLKACAFGAARAVIWLQNQPSKRRSNGLSVITRSHSVDSSDGSVTSEQATTASASRRQLEDQANLVSLLQLVQLISRVDLLVDLPDGLNLDSLNADLENCSLDVLNQVFTQTAQSSRISGMNLSNQDNKPVTHIARLHKEFVCIPRLPQEMMDVDSRVDIVQRGSVCNSTTKLSTFWGWAASLMEEHASRKTELEIQFMGEDGTGLGPTLEFYSLLAAELRRRDSRMWVMDDASGTDWVYYDRPALPAVASVSSIECRNITSIDSTVDSARTGKGLDLDEESFAYVNTPHGLFPAPYPGDSVPEQVLYRFFILGITIAKCLQDNRRIDLPLSPPFLKILTAYGRLPDNQRISSIHEAPKTEHSSGNTTVLSNDTDFEVNFSNLLGVEGVFSSFAVPIHHTSSFSNQPEVEPSDLSVFLLSPQYRRIHTACFPNDQPSSPHWLRNLLSVNDFCLIYPEREKFIRQLDTFVQQKLLIDLDATPFRPKTEALKILAFNVFGCEVEDMCLTMEFLPPSRIFNDDDDATYVLRDVYPWERDVKHTDRETTLVNFYTTNRSPATKCSTTLQRTTREPFSLTDAVTVHNLDVYLTRTLAFCLDKGIRKQVDAFKAGFERVLPLSWLALFTGSELGQLIAGDSVVQWSREELLAYTVPCFGFTRDSSTYQMLIDVLSAFNTAERRAFLQFTTGCSSLPPGGLKNLHPRLHVVRKEASRGAYPSVNTCAHYLKLPVYQTMDELRSVLLRATREVGFYLN